MSGNAHSAFIGKTVVLKNTKGSDPEFMSEKHRIDAVETKDDGTTFFHAFIPSINTSIALDEATVQSAKEVEPG
jgi:hypothetical protein